MDEDIQTLEELLRRFSSTDRLPEIQRVKFADAVRTGEDPLSIVRYFGTLGIAVREPADLFRLNDDPNEEEVNAFWIPEGVAVSIASDDEWLVFEVDHTARKNETEMVSTSNTTPPTARAEGGTPA
jgi:hypothetical protein